MRHATRWILLGLAYMLVWPGILVGVILYLPWEGVLGGRQLAESVYESLRFVKK